MNRLQAIHQWHHTHVRVPAGWRDVGADEAIKAGDRFWAGDNWVTVRKDDSRIGMRCDPETFAPHITPV